MEHKIHYFYKITNVINGKVYYGIHSTDNINDKYLGSGARLNDDKRKFGKENFKREIIKIFETRKDASDFEHTYVTEELVKDRNCYNIKEGGDYGLTIGTILVIDSNGEMHRCTKDDENIITGKWKPFTKDVVFCLDSNTGQAMKVSKEEFWKNRYKYNSYFDNEIVVKDDEGNCFQINKNDERYKSGELKAIWCGRKHSEETKHKMHLTHELNHHQQGKKNSQYGTCWINDGNLNKKVSKCDANKYFSEGWKAGRIWVPTEKCYRSQSNLDKNEIFKLISEGESKTSIAKKFSITRNTLNNFIKRNNINKQ